MFVKPRQVPGSKVLTSAAATPNVRVDDWIAAALGDIWGWVKTLSPW